MATHTLFKLPGFNCVSLVASPPLEISSYTTNWKPYHNIKILDTPLLLVYIQGNAAGFQVSKQL